MDSTALRTTGVTGGDGSLHGVATVHAGSPPPLSVTGFVTLLGAFGSTFTVKPKVLLPLTPIGTLLVQVMTLALALQVQAAPLTPLVATTPFGTTSPAGSASVSVIVPVVGT